MRYQWGEDEQGQPYTLNDPMAARTQALAQQHRGDVEGTVVALLSLKEIWRDVPVSDVRWSGRVAHWLRRIHEAGVLAAAAQVCG
jgi:mannitol-1-phosphate/altronate dehydrogenase